MKTAQMRKPYVPRFLRRRLGKLDGEEGGGLLPCPHNNKEFPTFGVRRGQLFAPPNLKSQSYDTFGGFELPLRLSPSSPDDLSKDP